MGAYILAIVLYIYPNANRGRGSRHAMVLNLRGARLIATSLGVKTWLRGPVASAGVHEIAEYGLIACLLAHML
jgi:hypothetical protein